MSGINLTPTKTSPHCQQEDQVGIWTIGFEMLLGGRGKIPWVDFADILGVLPWKEFQFLEWGRGWEFQLHELQHLRSKKTGSLFVKAHRNWFERGAYRAKITSIIFEINLAPHRNLCFIIIRN